MTPFARYALAAVEGFLADDHAAADSGPEDDAEGRFCTASRTQTRLGEGEAVGVVGEFDWYPQRGLEIVLQWPVDQAGGIAVFHGAVLRVKYAGRADADARRFGGGFRAHGLDESDDAFDDMLVALLRLGGDTDAAQGVGCVGCAEDHAFDLGPPQVDTPVLFGHAMVLSLSICLCYNVPQCAVAGNAALSRYRSPCFR
jgi:hypothetical protein